MAVAGCCGLDRGFLKLGLGERLILLIALQQLEDSATGNAKPCWCRITPSLPFSWLASHIWLPPRQKTSKAAAQRCLQPYMRATWS